MGVSDLLTFYLLFLLQTKLYLVLVPTLASKTAEHQRTAPNKTLTNTNNFLSQTMAAAVDGILPYYTTYNQYRHHYLHPPPPYTLSMICGS